MAKPTKPGQDSPTPAQGPQPAPAKKRKKKPGKPMESKMRSSLAPEQDPRPQQRTHRHGQRLINGLDAVAALAEDDKEKPESPREILNRLLSGAFSRLKDSATVNKGVENIAAVVDRIQSGQPLKEMKGELGPLLAEQQAKINLLQAVMLNHDMELMALYADMRWRLVHALWEDLRAQQLNPMEKMTLLKMAVGEAESVQERISGVNPNFTPMTELESVNSTLERVEKPVTDKDIADRVNQQAGENAQSRDLMLKLSYKAKDAATKLMAQSKPAAAEPPPAPAAPAPAPVKPEDAKK